MPWNFIKKVIIKSFSSDLVQKAALISDAVTLSHQPKLWLLCRTVCLFTPQLTPYQIILLGDEDACVLNDLTVALTAQRLGLNPRSPISSTSNAVTTASLIHRWNRYEQFEHLWCSLYSWLHVHDAVVCQCRLISCSRSAWLDGLYW